MTTVTDLQGNAITSGTTVVAAAVKFEANKVRLVIGVATLAQDNGEYYLSVALTSGYKRYSGDYARVPCIVTGATTVQCLDAVVPNSSTAEPAGPSQVPPEEL